MVSIATRIAVLPAVTTFVSKPNAFSSTCVYHMGMHRSNTTHKQQQQHLQTIRHVEDLVVSSERLLK